MWYPLSGSTSQKSKRVLSKKHDVSQATKKVELIYHICNSRAFNLGAILIISKGERGGQIEHRFFFTDIALKFIVLQFCTFKLKKHTDEKCILYFTFTMFSVYDHSWLSNKIILLQFCTFKLEKHTDEVCILRFTIPIFFVCNQIWFAFVWNILQ